jgi:hypothetical protein
MGKCILRFFVPSFARLIPQSPLHLPSSGTSWNTPDCESRPSRDSIPSSNHHHRESSHRRNTHFPQTSTFRFRLLRRRGEEDVQAFRSRVSFLPSVAPLSLLNQSLITSHRSRSGKNPCHPVHHGLPCRRSAAVALPQNMGGGGTARGSLLAPCIRPPQTYDDDDDDDDDDDCLETKVLLFVVVRYARRLRVSLQCG